MKSIRVICAAITAVMMITACGNAEPDYPDVTVFETALNSGEDLTGKTVCFCVSKLVPVSAFGYNLQAGNHLNFCSKEIPDPEIAEGDTVTVKVTAVSIVMGSYIIRYKRL